MSDEPARATSTEVVQHRALAVVAFASAAALFLVALPLGAGLFLGAVTAFAILPLHARLVAKLKRRFVASLLCTIGAGIIIATVLSGIAGLLIVRGSTLFSSFAHASPQQGVLTGIEDKLAGPLARFGVDPHQLTTRLKNGAETIASQSARVLASAGALLAELLLGVVFMVLTIFFMLDRWPTIVKGLEELLPLKPDHTKKLLDSLRAVGGQVMIGTVGVGVAQGVLAGIGYLITGAPDPAFFGAMTSVASLIPGVGTMCIWVPLGIYLIATGHVAGGVVLFIYGSLVVIAFCDGVLRPKLVSGSEDAGFFPTLIGLFGGIEIFGVMGLVIGPTLVGFAIAALKLYQEERAKKLSALRC